MRTFHPYLLVCFFQIQHYTYGIGHRIELCHDNRSKSDPVLKRIHSRLHKLDRRQGFDGIAEKVKISAHRQMNNS